MVTEKAKISSAAFVGEFRESSNDKSQTTDRKTDSLSTFFGEFQGEIPVAL
jgi:hypothetical protein